MAGSLPGSSLSRDVGYAGGSAVIPEDDEFEWPNDTFFNDQALYLDQSGGIEATDQIGQNQSVVSTPEPKHQEDADSIFPWEYGWPHGTWSGDLPGLRLDSSTPLIGPDELTVHSLSPSTASSGINRPLGQSSNYSSFTSLTSLGQESSNRVASHDPKFNDPTSTGQATTASDAASTRPRCPADQLSESSLQEMFVYWTISAIRSNMHASRTPPESVPVDSFECAECGRTFQDKHGLKRHKLTHGANRFVCPAPFCKYGVDGEKGGFARRDNGRRHLASLHPGLEVPLIEM
ncbi:MAG: hypothetical protein M1819_003526 [Sarea resinae]|nr:MAG: hypothetical protein M1819_003526 [Sarea resinae]